MDFTCFSRLTDVSLKESKQNRLTEMLPSTWSMSSPLRYCSHSRFLILIFIFKAQSVPSSSDLQSGHDCRMVMISWLACFPSTFVLFLIPSPR
ncbi:hypothetical protein NPIL_663941 [Nephila pilipes]|uniref:Uncharacterized protein n=1 Tax=Nephila pilipes TaxID=299642 RepID=A0A8X6J8J2_NEPPI|nr:hypothetical protein NPIL_663941 [Nephila pilipes]